MCSPISSLETKVFLKMGVRGVDSYRNYTKYCPFLNAFNNKLLVELNSAVWFRYMPEVFGFLSFNFIF